MRQPWFNRRRFLGAAPALGAISAATVMESLGQGANQTGQAVPWSSGTERPHTRLPPNSTDCHHHIYDDRFPVSANAVLRPANATVTDYRLLQKRLGTSRNVIVQPSTYGVDNSCLLNALQQFGLENSRGIAVVEESVSDAELAKMDRLGVRGIRFNVVQAGGTPLEMVEPLAKRVIKLGWHIQVNALPKQIQENAALWSRLPTEVVFDHLAHVLLPDEADSAFALIVSLLQKGKAWVKLSGIYIDSAEGPPAYSDRAAIVKAYVREAPQRLLWGTDWPHPTAREKKPDDALLLDLLTAWVPDESVRHQIFVENPARLYGFSSGAFAMTSSTELVRSEQSEFTVIGIEARTTNAKEASAAGVIGKQWQRLFSESLLQQIPEKLDDQIYALYTNYESDEKGAYNFVLGARVRPGTTPPPGMVQVNVPKGQYVIFTSEQGPAERVGVETWKRIWAWPPELKNSRRAFKTDFEVHDSQGDPQQSQVKIYIGID